MTKILLPPTASRVASDEQLVGLVRAGDDRAFTAIHDRYEPRLLAYARQLLGGAHHDAEEVVQDAFVRALHALRADDREMALRAWLYTIVRNRALDVLRRPVRTTDLEPHAAVLADAGGDPHERLARNEELGPLVASMKRLPARQRTALVMHEMGGCSHRAIAEHLDVTTGGSKALVSRARAWLAQARAAARAPGSGRRHGAAPPLAPRRRVEEHRPDRRHRPAQLVLELAGDALDVVARVVVGHVEVGGDEQLVGREHHRQQRPERDDALVAAQHL